MASVEFDTSNLFAGFSKLTNKMKGAQGLALEMVGRELLRLSTQQIPHDKGLLQNSAEVEMVSEDEIIAGFNKVYAAYQHEGSWPDGSHVIVHYQKGRKGHYLSDPLKLNVGRFEKVLGQTIATNVMGE